MFGKNLMKKNLIVLFLSGLLFLQFGCGGNNSDNSNQASTNTEIPSAENTPLPEFTDAQTALAEGNKLFDVNKTDLAIQAYNQAVKLDPDLAEAWFKLGISYSLIEREKEIESVNEQQEDYSPTPTPTPAKKGKKDEVVRTKDSEKAFEQAVKAYKKIIAKNPKDDVAYYNLGRAYNKLDEDEDAEKALKEAVELNPESTEYQTEYGAILIKLAQYDRAIKALKKALELDPENSEADELLEKAEAGKKRIDFATPKPQQTQQDTSPKVRSTVKPESEATPKPPDDKPKNEPKVDKKGSPQ